MRFLCGRPVDGRALIHVGPRAVRGLLGRGFCPRGLHGFSRELYPGKWARFAGVDEGAILSEGDCGSEPGALGGLAQVFL